MTAAPIHLTVEPYGSPVCKSRWTGGWSRQQTLSLRETFYWLPIALHRSFFSFSRRLPLSLQRYKGNVSNTCCNELHYSQVHEWSIRCRHVTTLILSPAFCSAACTRISTSCTEIVTLWFVAEICFCKMKRFKPSLRRPLIVCKTAEKYFCCWILNRASNRLVWWAPQLLS